VEVHIFRGKLVEKDRYGLELGSKITKIEKMKVTYCSKKI